MSRIGAGIGVLFVAAALVACERSSAPIAVAPTATAVVSPIPTASVYAPVPTPTMAAAPSGALLFRASGNGRYDVFRVDADGANLVNLTNSGDQSYAGSPSPDGTRIALTQAQRIVVSNRDGSNPQDVGPGTFVSWSPDGAHILYANFGETYGEWWVMKRDGSGAKLVVARCGPCASPQWLPDSSSLVAELPVDRDVQTSVGIFVIGIDGAVLKPLPGTPRNYGDLQVSPDGRQIAFTTGGLAATTAIQIIAPDGSGLREAWHGSQPRGLAWSPDSTRIAFSGEIVAQPSAPSPPQSTSQLVKLDVASGSSQVLDGGVFIDDIAWSPDGRRLAYAASRGLPANHFQVYAISASGGTPENISNGPWNDKSPRWSTDGGYIFFGSDRESRDGVYWLDAVTASVHLAQPLNPSGLASDELPSPATVGRCDAPSTYPGEGYVSGCLSPDGRLRTAVTRDRLDVSYVATGSVVATSPEGLVVQPSPPAWSPDGTRIAFIGGRAGDTSLYVLDVSTGQSQRLVLADALGASGPLILWSRDGTSIYYPRGGYCGNGCIPGYLYRVSADGSGEAKVTDLRVVTLYGFAP